MKYTESQVREFSVNYKDPCDLFFVYNNYYSIDFLREFNNIADMDELVCRLYNNYRILTDGIHTLSFATWIDMTEPKLKEFLKKDRRRLWDK